MFEVTKIVILNEDRRPLGIVGPWLRLSILALTTLVSGCSCGSKEVADTAAIEAIRQRLAEENQQDEEEAKKARRKEAAEKAKQQRGSRAKPAWEAAEEEEEEKEKRRLAAEAEAAAAAAAAEAARRPDDVADWVKKDYCSARLEGDPRLVAAVQHLGKQFVGNASAAGLLRSLLEPVDVGARQPDAESPTRARTAMSEPLIEAIVTALMQNGTDVAKQTVKELLTGTLRTDDVRLARETALQALGRHPHPNSELMLFWALTQAAEHAADATRPVHQVSTGSDSSPRNAAQREAEILDVLRPYASAKIRVMLAQHIGGPFVPPRRREMITELLREPDPRNLGAQVILFEDFDAPVELKDALEQYFIFYSSTALRRLLEIPEETGPGPSTHADSSRAGVGQIEQIARTDPDLAARVARELWSERFVEHVLGELHHIDSLAEPDPTIVLAATMPFDSIRTKIQETLNRNWQDGPEVLERVGLGDDLFIDPGLLVAMKMVPRDLPPLTELAKNGRSVRREGNEEIAEMAEARQQRARIRQAWLKVSGRLILAMCSTLEQASRARDARSGQATPPAPPSMIVPIPLHENARIVAWYRIRLPASNSQDPIASKLSPLAVDYVRIEEANQLAKVLRYYEHQLRSAETYYSERGIWLDTLETLDESNRTRSTDVIITRGETGLPGRVDDVERLSIEILSVDINTPKSGR